MMKASEFVAKAIDIAKNYKTLYVMGCFGAPMTAANKKRYTQNHNYNKQAARTAMINAASADTFGFDCVCLIKGLLWGWCGDASKSYGGATYPTAAMFAAGAVPDLSADGMIAVCKDVSTDFSKIEVGEAVWMSGHIGVYIGGGLAVECTPSWQNKAQVTACNCAKSGYNRRNWTKHGKLPYVAYTGAAESVTGGTTATTTPSTTAKEAKAKDAAQSFDKSLAGTYAVNTVSGLHIRSGAGTSKDSFAVLPNGTQVRNYGYYTLSGGVKWLYVQVTYNGVTYTGFMSSQYLRKQ